MINTTEVKENIQVFVYFIFSGNFSKLLIDDSRDFVSFLLDNPKKLLDCFQCFASAIDNQSHAEKIVSNYIIASMNNEPVTVPQIIHVKGDLSYEFMEIARQFCLNEFPNPVNYDYLKDLNGCGTDAVPIFAVWLNNLKFSSDGTVENAQFALERANQRIKVYDGTESFGIFKEYELNQYIW